MDLKVNAAQDVVQTTVKAPLQPQDESFRFTLISHIEDAALSERLNSMMEEITRQGERIGKRTDIRDMRRYRQLIKEFMNEIVSRSHQFSRENFLDRRGRHRVFGMVRLIDRTLDELAEELLKEAKDHLLILSKIDDIRGMLLDIFT